MKDAHRDFAWRALNRFDTLTTGANTKAGIILTFNTFYLGLVIASWRIGLGTVQADKSFAIIILLVQGLGTTLSFASICFTAFAINPYMKSHKEPGCYHSFLFFFHVSESTSAIDYYSRLNSADMELLDQDIAIQAHALAVGLKSKFNLLRVALTCFLWGPLLSLFVLHVLHLFTSIRSL